MTSIKLVHAQEPENFFNIVLILSEEASDNRRAKLKIYESIRN